MAIVLGTQQEQAAQQNVFDLMQEMMPEEDSLSKP
jgi:hypothetical protein